MYLRDNVDVSESEQASNQGRQKKCTPRAFQILVIIVIMLIFLSESVLTPPAYAIYNLSLSIYQSTNQEH